MNSTIPGRTGVLNSDTYANRIESLASSHILKKLKIIQILNVKLQKLGFCEPNTAPEPPVVHHCSRIYYRFTKSLIIFTLR